MDTVLYGHNHVPYMDTIIDCLMLKGKWNMLKWLVLYVGYRIAECERLISG